MNSWLGSLLNRALAGGQRPRLLSCAVVKCVFRPKKMVDRIPSAEVHVHFCLLRSPDQKTEHVVVVVIHGATFLYWKLLTCERSLKDKMLDIDELSKCENF